MMLFENLCIDLQRKLMQITLTKVLSNNETKKCKHEGDVNDEVHVHSTKKLIGMTLIDYT